MDATQDPGRHALQGARAIVCGWAGHAPAALFASGAHALGEGVWVPHDGGRVTLSPVELWVVVRDEAARARARAGRRAARGTHDALRVLGIAAPLIVSFQTAETLRRLPPTPATLELARTGRLVDGPADAIRWLPAPSPGAVPFEETLLHLEDLGIALLRGRPREGASALERSRSRHAALAAAAGLADVLALAHGEWPGAPAQRVEWARRNAHPAMLVELPDDWRAMATPLPALWDAAMAWMKCPHDPGPEPLDREWRAVTQAWCATWWRLAPVRGRDPWERIRNGAARASLGRRLGWALRPAGGPAARRRGIGGAIAGTPRHRVNASACVLLMGAALASHEPALPAGALRALEALGVAQARDWERARLEIVRAWDALEIGGPGPNGDAS